MFLFLAPNFVSIVSASEEWEEDGWLNNQWTEMRLDNGDEFGCHGMPNMDLSKETYETAIACREYLEGMTAASRWSDKPVSFGVDEKLTYSKHKLLSQAGFTVHGVNTELDNTSWHNSDDYPLTIDSWWNLGQVGSIESGASELSEIQSLAENGGLINLYWEARIADLKLRTNSDLVNWLESNNSWMTTWGEAWSYWNFRSELFDVSQMDPDSWEIEFNTTSDSQVWEIPITRGFVVGEGITQSVYVDGAILSESSSNSRKLDSGWRQDGSILYLTISSGDVATVNFDIDLLANNSSPCHENHSSKFTNCESIERPLWYNNHSWALTITGHHTTNLFDWSNKFDESPLVFTWLVMPTLKDEYTLLLPLVGVVVAVATIWYAKKIILEDRKKRVPALSDE